MTFSVKACHQLLIATLLIVLLVIGLGVYTRLADAGLGCPDWPTCYGHFTWPNSLEQQAQAAKTFVGSYPAQFSKMWPEMIHRYAASLLGFIILIIAILCITLRAQKSLPLRLPIIMLLVVVWQGVFGALTVTEKLHPLVVLIHLLGGFTTLSLIAIMLLRTSQIIYNFNARFYLYWSHYIWWVFACLVLQIASGGWMSANYAALSCVELPTCSNGLYFPVADYRGAFLHLPEFNINHDGGVMTQQQRLAIHLFHRIGAIFTTILIVILSFCLWQSRQKRAQQFAPTLLALVTIQIGLGLANIYFVLPITVAVLHNLFAALLVATMALLLWSISDTSRETAIVQ